MRSLSVLLFALLTASCVRGQATSQHAQDATNAADSQLRAFLDRALITPHRRQLFTGLYTCSDDEHADRVRALWTADYRVLSVQQKADSMKAEVVLTTVADQRETPTGWIA